MQIHGALGVAGRHCLPAFANSRSTDFEARIVDRSFVMWNFASRYAAAAVAPAIAPATGTKVLSCQYAVIVVVAVQIKMWRMWSKQATTGTLETNRKP
jgi:hypothetical protein